jgi:PAS domain S-box-containing protein
VSEQAFVTRTGAFRQRALALRTDRRRPVYGPARVTRYRLLFEDGADAFSRHDRSGRFLDVSPAAAVVFGQAPGDLEKRRWQDLVHWGDRTRFDGWWQSLQGGSAGILTFRIHRPDGSVAHVESAARAGLLLDEGVFEVQALTRATPTAVDSPEALARRCQELEGRAAGLDLMNRDLARFAADTAHDLRAPLQVISGFAQLIARGDAERLEEPSQRALAVIQAAVHDMAELIDSALASASRRPAQHGLSRVDAGEIAYRALSRLQTQVEASDVTVVVEELPIVYCDAVQLGRVFQNLVANALKAARSGQPLRISLSSRTVDGGVEISVTDNGIGVPAGDRERIFEMFSRSGHDDGGRGHGIGLAICRSIVERHGGRIWVEDEAGAGSRFVFFLPAMPPATLSQS